MGSGWDAQFGSNASFTLDEALDLAGCNYEDDFYEYWGLKAKEPPEWLTREDWLAIRRAFGMGEQAARLALALVAPKGVGQGHLEELAQVRANAEAMQRGLPRLLQIAVETENHELAEQVQSLEYPSLPDDPRTQFFVFENAVQLTLSGAVIPSLNTASTRIHRLLGWVVKVKNERVAAYLSRVARCYVLDLRPELAVMARATIAAALEEMFPDEVVARTVGSARGVEIGLARRISAAEAHGSLRSETIAALWQLKANGDHAAHASPGLEPTCDEQIELLSRALVGLLER